MLNFIKVRLLKCILCSIFVVNIAHAQYIDIQTTAQGLPTTTNLAFVAKNINKNKVIAEYKETQKLVPASVEKIITALVSKKVLGDSYQFTTSLYTNGKIHNGTLNGDLIVKFTGDPVFSSEDLKELLLNLHKYNIRNIQGNLIIDTSMFEGSFDANRKQEADYLSCYTAPGASINIDKNCLTIRINTKQINKAQIDNTPSVNAVNIQHDINVVGVKKVAKKTITKKKAKQIVKSKIQNKKSKAKRTRTTNIANTKKCNLSVKLDSNNNYNFKGCLKQRSLPWDYKVAIHNPVNYAGRLTKQYLTQQGIQLSGSVLAKKSTGNMTLIAEHTSPPLDFLLKDMLKHSDNQIADSLFIASAYHKTKKTISFAKAHTVIKNILKELKISTDNDVFKDGSGLSRENKLSAQTLLNVLDYIAKNDHTLNLMQHFPIAGKDGTLKKRGSMINNENLTENITAKTGTMKDIVNLAGFMKNNKGELIAFVQLVNNYPIRAYGRKTLYDVEEQIYNNIYLN